MNQSAIDTSRKRRLRLTGFDHKERHIVHVRKPGHPLLRVHHSGDQQINDPADSSHQIDDRVRTAAKRLPRNVRHQRDRRAPVGSHGDQDEAQHRDKACELHTRRLGGVAVVDDRQEQHECDRGDRPEQNERLAPSHTGSASVRKRAEKRQKEQGEDIVHRHDHAGQCLVQMESVRENKGDHVVVHLPEGSDRKKCKSHAYRLSGLQFHKTPPCIVLRRRRSKNFSREDQCRHKASA